MSSRAVHRRTVLRAAALAPALGVAAGCAGLGRATGLGDPVRIAVSWSGTELAAFQRVLGPHLDECELGPLGDDIDAALGANPTGRPDIVALPQPNLVGQNLTRLAPLPDEVWHPEFDELWSPQLPATGGRHHAVPFKLAHSSVVWYRKQLFVEHGLELPRTWEQWLELNERIAELTDAAPLALGGADGWLLARFFENVLLRQFDGTYDALVRGERGTWAGADVRAALGMVAEMWGAPGALAGGAERALVTQYPEAVLEVFHYRHAAMAPAPAFAESVIRSFGVPDEDVGTFSFPADPGLAGRLVVSGDLLVLTAPASPAARRVLRHLCSPDAPVPWIRDTGGFIAANPETDAGEYTQNLRELAQELKRSSFELQFGLSDIVALGDVLEEVLQNLLRALAAGVDPGTAAATAADSMADAERAVR
jgi:alpha-glucoside transport system substrate-binding protein